MAIYVRKNNEQTGPFDENHVLAGLRDGVYASSDPARREGMADWDRWKTSTHLHISRRRFPF
jgi:hypothetical protein